MVSALPVPHSCGTGEAAIKIFAVNNSRIRSVPMADYIVCRKKRNSPRLNVRICQVKCPLKNDCKEYLAFLKPAVAQEQVSVNPESAPLILAGP